MEGGDRLSTNQPQTSLLMSAEGRTRKCEIAGQRREINRHYFWIEGLLEFVGTTAFPRQTNEMKFVSESAVGSQVGSLTPVVRTVKAAIPFTGGML